MATEQTQDEPTATQLLAELMLLGADRRTPAAGVIEALRGQGYSVRQISRETGIPRTTLHRWTETSA